MTTATIPRPGFNERADGTVELFRAGGRRFYPQTFQRHRPPGIFRIFTVGDSVPRGPSFKAAYPWLLGHELRRHDIPAESINLAVPGYGARRCQHRARRRPWSTNPASWSCTSMTTNKWEDEREWRRSQEFKGWHPRHWLMKVFIFRRLYEAKMEKVFWPLVPEEVRLRYALNDADAQVAAGHDPKESCRPHPVGRRNRGGKCGHAPANGIFPSSWSPSAGWRKTPGTTFASATTGWTPWGRSLAGPGVYHISMKDVFSRMDFRRSFANFSGHLHQEGHQLLAHAIFEKIEQERAALGLPGPKVAVAGKPPDSHPIVPQP